MPEDANSTLRTSWARQTYEFLRLSAPLKGTLTGLMLLQGGWAAALVFLAKLGGDSQLPALNLPWPKLDYASGGWPTLAVQGRDVPLTWLYARGAIALTIAWTLQAGTLEYFWRPIWRIVYHALYAVCTLVVVLVLVPMFYVPFHGWRLLRSLHLARRPDQAMAWHGLSKEERYSEIALGRFPPVRWLRLGIVSAVWILKRVTRDCVVGLSPFVSTTAEQREGTMKAFLQAFPTALVRLRASTANILKLRGIRLKLLPMSTSIRSTAEAQRIRRWLWLDGVLWGSYSIEHPHRVLLSLAQRGLHKHLAASADSEAPFRGYEGWLPVAVDFDPQSPVDAYVVLALAFGQGFIHMDRRLPWIVRCMPREFSMFCQTVLWLEAGESLLDHVAVEAGPRLLAGEAGRSDSALSSATQLLANATDRWIARMIQRADDDRVFRSLGDVLRIAIRRKQTEARSPEPWYRVAALQYLTGRTDEARDTLQEARSRRASGALSGHGEETEFTRQQYLRLVESALGRARGEASRAGMAMLYVYIFNAMPLDPERSKQLQQLVTTSPLYLAACPEERAPLVELLGLDQP